MISEFTKIQILVVFTYAQFVCAIKIPERKRVPIEAKNILYN